jgi:RimJ/RimL family protein N-acetyltransferase
VPEHLLQGEFVDLLPLQPEHAALTHAWRQDPRAVYLNRGAASVAQQAAWIAARPASEYNWVIALKSGKPVGMVSLLGIEPLHRHAEPGRFLIGAEESVRGVPAAVEAMKLLYQLAFDQLKLLRLWGTVAADNTLMIKWQRFLGMKEEGRLRSHYFINGHQQDAVVFGLLEADYRSAALPRMNALIQAGRAAASRHCIPTLQGQTS